MKSHIFSVWLVLILVVSTPLNTALATDFDDASAPISQNTLDLRIKDLQANITLEEETKAKLLELYRKTIRYLEEVRSNSAASDAFIRSKKSDSERAGQIRERLERRKQRRSAVTVGITAGAPFDEMEDYLFTENANLETVKAKLSDVEQQLALAAARPNQIRQRVIEAMNRQEDITAQLLQPIPEDEQPLLTEARRWMLETRQLALRSEIRRLDQELLSRPMRIELLKAYKARHAFVAEQLEKQVVFAQQLVNQHRQVVAEKEQAAAEKAQRELEGKPPVVQQLAAWNAALTDALTHLTSEFERVTQRIDATKRANDRMTDEFRSVRKKIDVGGFGRVLGQVLIEQKYQLPDLASFRKRQAVRADRSAEIGLQQLQYSEEYGQLSSLSSYVGQFITTQPEKEARRIRGDLEKLAVSRQHLLERMIDLSVSYLHSLSALEFSEQALFSTIQDYQSFLDQHLLWIRSGPLPSLATLRKTPSQLAAGLIAPARWRDVAAALGDQATRSPVLVLGLIVVAVLFWKSKSIRATLTQTGANIGKISKDSIAVTFHALGLTLLLAASWPLLLAVLGWQPRVSPQATDFTNVISQGLLWVATPFFGFGVLRVMYEPDGLAAAHFHVPMYRNPVRGSCIVMSAV